MWSFILMAQLMLGCSSTADDEGPILVPGTPSAPAAAVATGPCADNCQLLLEHDYGALADGGFCETCKGKVADACATDWPASEPMACDEYDYLRNCIYARLGYEFDTAPEWREVFDAKDWYSPDPNFDWNNVSPVQAANAAALKKVVDGRRCKR